MNSYKFFDSDNSLSEDLPRIYFDNKANDGYESFINKINKEILILSQSFNPADNSISLDSITNDDLVDELTSTDSSVPILQINIFGGLTVKFGDNDVVSTSIGRQHIKALIAILVIANGNEVSKDRLSELIWPESNSYSRKASMNSLWYQLRTILSLNDGRCPYLIKNQNSYKILKKYVHSDLDTLEHICADLTLGGIDSQIWWEKIENNEGIFNGDLLPSETSNSYILKKRKEFNMKITDSLVAAANRLIDADQIPQALWFARKALSKDDKREDVYITLMKAQLKAGQRTPAIETYFACKNFLEEIHGIAPSSELNFMYKQVVNGDTNTKKLA